MFHGFPKESLAFLETIASNNTKEWFELHKGKYQDLLLQPSRDFVKEMGEHLQALVPTINALPKINGSLFRIYRDTRFSRDKAPIKTRIGIIFWQGSAKRMQSSAFYFQFEPTNLMFAVGIRSFTPELLAAYRTYIKDEKHRTSLHHILENIKSKGYSLPETRYKRYPKGHDKKATHAYLSLYDAMYAFKLIPPDEHFFAPDLVLDAYKTYEDLFELQQWVYAMTLTVERKT